MIQMRFLFSNGEYRTLNIEADPNVSETTAMESLSEFLKDKQTFYYNDTNAKSLLMSI